jgi:hypothetical protein
MKKKIIIFFICLLVLSLGYVYYKSFLLFNFKVEINDELEAKLKDSTETITIKQNVYDENNDYTEYDNVIYKKLGTDFIYSDESITNSQYPLYVYSLTNKQTNKLDAVFKVSKTDSYYELLVADAVTSSGFKNIDKKALLKKYNLNNDSDVYTYIINNYDKNLSIFSSRDEIELNYLIKTFANTVIPDANIIFITGDLSGFMYVVNDNIVYEVHIINNNKNYVFSFFNQNNSNYFNLDYVKEFINNIYFKK